LISSQGIPRFYDIGGFLANPEIFQKIVDIFVNRYEEIGIDAVAG
jgi:adenine phosphoribosyltransferase